MSVKPFVSLTLTANDQTVTASFDAPAAGWDRADSSGQSDFATDSGFSSNVTSSTDHPAAGTMRSTDFPFTTMPWLRAGLLASLVALLFNRSVQVGHH